MNQWLPVWLLAAVGLGLAAPVRAQSLDEQYVRIYNLIQQADSQRAAGQPTDALARYLEAQTALKRVQQSYPDWNARLVTFRLEYIADKITSLSTPPSGRTNGASVLPAGQLPAGVSGAGGGPPGDSRVAQFEDQVRRLQGDKLILEAKLKEALAARPAAIDPRELAKAEDRIRSLAKENDLLKASLASEKSGPATRPPAPAVPPPEATDAASALRAENELLKQQVAELRTATPSRRNTQLQQRLTEAEARYAVLRSDVEILNLEKAALQNQVRSMTNTLARAITLRQEDLEKLRKLESERNDLARRVALATAAAPAAARPEEAARLRQLEQENAGLRQQLSARPAQAATRPEDALRSRQLELERDQLKRDLEAANVKLASRETRTASRRVEQLTTDIETLKARVQVFEARAVPYSQEELALFQPPAAPVLTRDAATPPEVINRELPAGGANLAAEARRHLANRDFAKAEASYQQILRLDATNAQTLANLGALQMGQGKLADAEKNLRAAIETAPQDAYCQSLYGILCFRREKYDDALEALSRAARLEPNNAEVQNYLGMTLSEKGLRGPAETALRKAIELEPNNGSAHNNLAVIYLTQNPPLVELARWHYQKALAAKHPPNRDLEKMLEEKSKTK